MDKKTKLGCIWVMASMLLLGIACYNIVYGSNSYVVLFLFLFVLSVKFFYDWNKNHEKKKNVQNLSTPNTKKDNKQLVKLSVIQDISAELTAVIDNNLFFFSGFKTHREFVEASQLLKGKNGDFKPFYKFFEDIREYHETYNRSILESEYNFAVASAQMAVKWKEFKRDGDDYDLQYRTAGDALVSPEHATLNGITLPFSDPFWKSYFPPNSWNCHCDVVQVRKGKYKRSDSEKAIEFGNKMTNTPEKQIFRFNPGVQEKIFPKKHPFYKLLYTI